MKNIYEKQLTNKDNNIYYNNIEKTLILTKNIAKRIYKEQNEKYHYANYQWTYMRIINSLVMGELKTQIINNLIDIIISYYENKPQNLINIMKQNKSINLKLYQYTFKTKKQKIELIKKNIFIILYNARPLWGFNIIKTPLEIIMPYATTSMEFISIKNEINEKINNICNKIFKI